MLFSEPKIPQFRKRQPDLARRDARVSVLFSEPKIPQSFSRFGSPHANRRFSALQRAENSSIARRAVRAAARCAFQCSSASRKFLNPELNGAYIGRFLFQCSSASRKFLNGGARHPLAVARRFQCSSASRKFLNSSRTPARRRPDRGFSALQRAENSSMSRRASTVYGASGVSVLFSEPKIPQYALR